MVTAVVAERPALAPAAVAGAVKVTVTPLTGLPPESRTIACNGTPNALPTEADCGDPAKAATDADAVAVLVRENAALVAPFAAAATEYGPAMLLAVAVTDATPDAFVMAVGADKMAVAPKAGGVKDTTAPGTGLLPASRTVACSALEYAPPMILDCGVPPVATINTGAPGALVSVNAADVAPPATAAVTAYEPAVPFAVGLTVATPDKLEIAVADDSVAPAPLPGGENVTVAPATRLPKPSRTVACSGLPNAELIAAVCGVPPVAETALGAPVVLVSTNKAGVATPPTDAVTL